VTTRAIINHYWARRNISERGLAAEEDSRVELRSRKRKSRRKTTQIMLHATNRDMAKQCLEEAPIRKLFSDHPRTPIRTSQIKNAKVTNQPLAIYRHEI
jgi:hypothetical protein